MQATMNAGAKRPRLNGTGTTLLIAPAFAAVARVKYAIALGRSNGGRRES